MGMYWHAGLAADIPKRRLERRIGERFTATLAQGDPERLSVGKRLALVLQIALVYGPEIICDRNTMLIPRSLQTNHDESALAINIGKRHAQDAMPTCAGTPISDPLPGAAEQCENGLVSKGRGGINELLYICGFQALRYFIGNSAAKTVTLLGSWWGVAPYHPMTQFLIEQRP
jgi:hypothetical protein